MIIKNYWQLAASALPEGYCVFEQQALPGPPEFLQRLKPAEGIVLGAWDRTELIGRVTALGVSLEKQDGLARIDWREVDITLKPNPSGRPHWQAKPFFGFAASVAERYALADLFAENFPDLDAHTLTTPQPSSGVSRRLPTATIPGYVYLIRSQHGFKIGKTINIKSRVRLFEVKLPFRISVEHYAWFENYSEAERSLHETFRAKRLEGEWFDLDASDIEHIKRLGQAATQDELRGL